MSENEIMESVMHDENSPVITMKKLLEAGVHFGHQTRRWNPKMGKYIYGARNGVYIIDLQKSVEKIEVAYKALKEIVDNGGKVLFVGTKKQCQEAVQEEALRSGSFYITSRWLGGTLTNFKTLSNRIKYLKTLDAQAEDGTFDSMPKKEVAALLKEREKLYNQKQLDSTKVEMFAAGTLGYSIAPEFAAFYAYNSSVVDVKDIIDGNVEPSILNDLEPEIVYLLLESLSEEVLRILGEKGESNIGEDVPDDVVVKIANLVNWIIDASSYRLDYAVMMISEIASRSEKFRHMVLFNDTFDEKCPKYEEFCSDNSIVFGED